MREFRATLVKLTTLQQILALAFDTLLPAADSAKLGWYY